MRRPSATAAALLLALLCTAGALGVARAQDDDSEVRRPPAGAARSQSHGPPPPASTPPLALLLQGEACAELDAQLKDVGRQLVKAQADVGKAAGRLEASEAALAQATARVAALEGEAKVGG